MRINDYEAAKGLNDVSLMLTTEEAEELAIYLERLLNTEGVNHVHLSEVVAGQIERELTICLDRPEPTLAVQCA